MPHIYSTIQLKPEIRSSLFTLRSKQQTKSIFVGKSIFILTTYDSQQIVYWRFKEQLFLFTYEPYFEQTSFTSTQYSCYPLRPRSIVNEGNDRMDNATHTRVKFISSDQLIHGILASSSIFYAIPFEIYSYQGYIFRAIFISKIVLFYHIYTSNLKSNL